MTEITTGSLFKLNTVVESTLFSGVTQLVKQDEYCWANLCND